jgi:hypothetical protein
LRCTCARGSPAVGASARYLAAAVVVVAAFAAVYVPRSADSVPEMSLPYPSTKDTLTSEFGDGLVIAHLVFRRKRGNRSFVSHRKQSTLLPLHCRLAAVLANPIFV